MWANTVYPKLINRPNDPMIPSCPHTPALPLLLCVLGGEIDCVDKYGNTPLHVAAKYGHELLISTLMTNGADTAR